MTPQVYCARLERALSLMPAAERQETIRYYLEFLEDASEEERAALGTPEALAQQILRENGISPQSAVIKHSNRTAKLIVLACTFYIWLPLLVTWYSLLLTALIVLICIPVSLGAVLLGGLFSFVITVFQDVPTALMLLGFVALAVGGIRLGYKATVKDLALELVKKAELSIMGSGQGAKKKKQVFAALRAKCPAAIRWAITDEVLDAVIEHAFDVMTAALGKKS